MRRLLLFLVVLALPASAATISGTACPGSGCSVSLVSGVTALAVQVTGTWSGTIELQLSLDGTNYVPTQARPVRGGSQVPSLTESGGWNVTTAGWKYIRFRATAWTSGAATITTAPSPVVLPLDITPVVGPTYGPIDATGTFNLSNSSLGALGTEYCGGREGERRWVIGTTPTLMPPNLPDGGSDPLRDRTRLTIKNYSDNRTVSCWPDLDGGVPDCNPGGVGRYVAPNFGAEGFLLEPGTRVRCRSCSGTAETYTEEQACVSP